jgi:hypothetical protein
MKYIAVPTCNVVSDLHIYRFYLRNMYEPRPSNLLLPFLSQLPVLRDKVDNAFYLLPFCVKYKCVRDACDDSKQSARLLSSDEIAGQVFHSESLRTSPISDYNIKQVTRTHAN